MEVIANRSHAQSVPPSLIEFLLGDGIHTGWLDEHGIPTGRTLANNSRQTSK